MYITLRLYNYQNTMGALMHRNRYGLINYYDRCFLCDYNHIHKFLSDETVN